MKNNKKSVIPKQWKDKYVCLKCGTVNKPTKGGSIRISGRATTARCYQCNTAVDTYNGSRFKLLFPIIMGPIVGIIAALVCVNYFIDEYSKLMGTGMGVIDFIIQIIIQSIPVILLIAVHLFFMMMIFLYLYGKYNRIKSFLENLNKIEGLAEELKAEDK